MRPNRGKNRIFWTWGKKLSKRHPTAPNVYSDVSCWQPYKVNSVETYCDTISDSQKKFWIGIVLLRALRLILKIFLVRSILKNIQLKPWNHKLEHKNNSMIFGFVGKSSINISKHCLYIHAVNSLNCNKKIKKNFIRQSSWVVKVMIRIVIKIDMCLASITNIWHPPI